MDNFDEMDAVLDAALDSLPLAPTPPGFTRLVISQIWKPQVTFRLDFLDLALPAFFALFGALIFATPLVAIAMLKPEWLQTLDFQMKLFLVRLPVIVNEVLPSLAMRISANNWLIAAGFCTAAVILITLAAGVFSLPFLLERRAGLQK